MSFAPGACDGCFTKTAISVTFQAAVQHVTPQHTQTLPSEGRSTQPINVRPNTVVIADDFSGMTASTSNETQRLITVEIEQNGHNITTITLNDGSTVGNY